MYSAKVIIICVCEIEPDMRVLTSVSDVGYILYIAASFVFGLQHSYNGKYNH